MPLAPLGITELLESTEAVIAGSTAVLIALGTAILTIYKGLRWLKLQIEQLQTQSGQTLHQVQNDHPPDSNLRDDIDALATKIDSQGTKIDRLGEGVEELRRSDSRQWQRAADLGSRDDRLDRRLAELERQQREDPA